MGFVILKFKWMGYVSGNPIPRGNEINISWNFHIGFLGIVLDDHRDNITISTQTLTYS